VGRTYARAHTLAEQAEQISQPEYLRELFYGQWIFHRVRGEHRLALALAEQMEKIGETRNNVTLQMVGRRTTGTQAGDYLVSGPGWKGTVPSGMTQIVAPNDTVLLIGRTLVESDSDLPDAYALARQIQVTAL
jgi:hypothetical protein